MSCLVAKLQFILLPPHGPQPAWLLCLWDFPGKNTGGCCYFLLRVIFLTQESNPRLLNWQGNSLPPSHLGKPTFMSTLSFIRCFHIQYSLKVAQSCPTICDPMDCSPWNSPGQNTGVCSLSLLQGIFSTQGPNPDLLHCGQILYQLSHKGRPQYSLILTENL